MGCGSSLQSTFWILKDRKWNEDKDSYQSLLAGLNLRSTRNTGRKAPE